MKDIKSALKEAREAIKNKDYKTSLDLCKAVLKEDKENYMALVFLGLSLQEVGPSNQAPNAFQKAIKANSENSLAWTGLANYYEKTNDDSSKKELVTIYINLLNIESSEKKLVEYTQKLAALSSECGDIVEISNAIYKLTKTDKCTGSCLIEIQKTLISMLIKIKNPSLEITNILEDTLLMLLNNQKTTRIEYYSEYLTILQKQNKTEQLLQHAKKMHELFELDTVSLKWLCKVYNECYIIQNGLYSEQFNEIEGFCDKLLRLEPESAMGLFTQSILLLNEGKVFEAKELLIKVTSLRPGLLHAWILLTQCNVKLYLYEEALYTHQKADKLLQAAINSKSLHSYTENDDPNNISEIIANLLNLELVEILSRSQENANWSKVLEIYRKEENSTLKVKFLPHYVRALIKLEKYSEVNLIYAEQRKSCGNQNVFHLLKAQLLRNEKKYKEALSLLDDDVYNSDCDIAEWWLEIGLIYWDLEEYNKCLVPFLKAAKCDPNYYIAFIHLGHYYQKINDLEKARRCYEKAFRSNGKSSEAGTELSKIYRKLKKWEENTMLLESLTTSPISKKSSWAWLQLGLNYYEQELYDKAIDNLRYVIRIDPNNMHCWETLADSYLAVGAYTSALKCYERTTQLSDNVLYSALQTAIIKKILGAYAEANAEFQEILRDNNTYVPALKGLAETCMLQAKECYREQRLGTARDYAQCSLDKLILAINQRADLCCLWKLIGDACCFVAKLPEKYCCLFVPSSLTDGNESGGNKILEKDELYSLAIRCYCKAISITQENFLLWHDLAACYLSFALNCDDKSKSSDNFLRALAAAQHCVTKNPTNWQHWNLLGNVAFHKNPPNYALAQHSFIKAVTINSNCSLAWSNLGTLYLFLGNIKLANKSFTQAQRSDPNYVNSWIGQALVAEQVGDKEAMDLFRHSTQLGAQQQGALGYGQWVCKTLLESEPNAVLYSIHNMHAIPVACDALTWYTEKNPNNGCAWNMLGILQERMGLKSSALKSFKQALHLTDTNNKDQCRVNYARLLSRMKKYNEAIEMFKEVKAATFSSGSGLALALFQDKQYEESYEAYDAALHWLTEEQSCQSDLLVALASMMYMFQGADSAKTLLFQSIQLKPPSPWGLYATLSLGLLHKDLKLANLVLVELKHLKDKQECLEHYATLLSYVYLQQGDYDKVVREVSKLVHRHPNQASLWLILSMVLLRLQERRPSSGAAAKCAQIAMKQRQTNMDVTKVLCLVALGLYLVGDLEKSLINAQKAVHCYPNVAEGWSTLLCTLTSSKKLNKKYLEGVSSYIADLCPTIKLSEWLKTQQQILLKL